MSPKAPGFAAMRSRRLRSLLETKLGYAVKRQRGGSHRILEARGRPDLLWAYHDGDEIGPARVRDILVKQAGLTLAEAKEVVRRG